MSVVLYLIIQYSGGSRGIEGFNEGRLVIKFVFLPCYAKLFRIDLVFSVSIFNVNGF